MNWKLVRILLFSIMISASLIYLACVLLAIKKFKSEVPYVMRDFTLYFTGIDVAKLKGQSMNTVGLQQALTKAKYIRIAINDKIRQEIKETGKICIPLFLDPVQITQ